MSEPIALRSVVLPANNSEILYTVYLVPVEVFGPVEWSCDGCGKELPDGYGLCDGDYIGSDCNRADKHIYRLADEWQYENAKSDKSFVKVSMTYDQLQKMRYPGMKSSAGQ